MESFFNQRRAAFRRRVACGSAATERDARRVRQSECTRHARTVTPPHQHHTSRHAKQSTTRAMSQRARARARASASSSRRVVVHPPRRRAPPAPPRSSVNRRSRTATPRRTVLKQSPAAIRSTRRHKTPRHGTPQTPAHQRHPRTRPSPAVRHTRCASLHEPTHARKHPPPPTPTSRHSTPNGPPRRGATKARARTSRVAARGIHLCVYESSRVR
jgi:hypothetical protein